MGRGCIALHQRRRPLQAAQATTHRVHPHTNTHTHTPTLNTMRSMWRRHQALMLVAALAFTTTVRCEEADDADDENVASSETTKEPAGPYSAPAFDGTANLIENFQDDAWSTRWVRAEDSKYAETNDYEVTNGAAPEGIANDQGLVLKSKAKHYGIASALTTPLSAKEGDIVIQYEVRLQNGLDCGGAYLKLLSSADNLKDLKDDSAYSIMFGPDKCGAESKVHFIFRHKNPIDGTVSEKHLKSRPTPKIDALSHLYTLHVHGNSFDIYIDGENVAKGDLNGDGTFDPPVVPPKEIDDPSDKKPADWVDEAKIPDPDASKPDDWDEDAPRRILDEAAEKPSGWEDDEPFQIPDPDAKPPEDWDEEDDGEWEAPLVDNPKCSVGCGEWKRPEIDNPAYKGKWSAPIIDNPEYKGEWKAKQIANPAFFEDDAPMANGVAPIEAAAIEVWTMSDGIAFDNILLTDNYEAAVKYGDATFGVKSKAQKAEEASVRAAEAKKRREADYESGGLAGKINYYVGEAMELVLGQPFISIPVILALIVASLYMCGCFSGDDDDYEQELQSAASRAAMDHKKDDDVAKPEDEADSSAPQDISSNDKTNDDGADSGSAKPKKKKAGKKHV